MKTRWFLLFSFLTLLGNGFAAEEANIKIAANTPVAYYGKLDINVKQKTAAGLITRGTANFESNQDVEISNRKNPPELLLTLHRINFHTQVGGLTIAYDTKTALSSNPLPFEKSALEQLIGKAYRIPLTTDPNYSADNLSDPYLVLPPDDKESREIFAKAVAQILKGLNEGETFVVGETHEEDHLDPLGLHRTIMVSHVDKDKVSLEEQDRWDKTWKDSEENGGGGLTLTGNGKIKKTIQRSNLLLVEANGNFEFTISETPGKEGKQFLHEGDLVVYVKIDLSSQQTSATTKK